MERKRILRKREVMRLQFLRSNNRLESLKLTPEELGEWVPCEDTKEDDPQLIVNNLLPCTKFIFRIRPITNPKTPWGDGIECDEVRTDMDCPDAPSSVIFGEITDYSIEIVWEKSYDNGLDVEKYEIHLSPKGQNEWYSACQTDNITTAIVSNLAIDKYYDFKVRAFNECGWGAFSSVVTKRTRAIEAPEPPCVDFQEAGDTFVRINWDIDPTNFKYAIEKWHIQYSECQRITLKPTNWCDATPSGGEVEGHCNSILVVPLKPTKNYVFRIRGWGGAEVGWSTFSAASKLYQSGRRY